MSNASGLWSRIEEVSARARVTGALVSMATQGVVIEDDGARFLVRILANLRRKDEATAPKEDSSLRRNPFLPYEEGLRVADLSPSHVCLLNKFQVVDHHVLIITRHFESQESPLTVADFAAWIACMREYPSIGFYNGGPAAGASQPHKHLQVIPAPLGEPGAPVVPLESWIREAAADGVRLFDPRTSHESGINVVRDVVSNGISNAEIGTVERFPFRHVVTRIESWEARHWHARYENARHALGIVATEEGSRRLPPHNVVVTQDWLFMIPRQRECFDGISLNSLAFVGAMLVRDDDQLVRLREAGPWRALAETGIRRVSARASTS